MIARGLEALGALVAEVEGAGGVTVVERDGVEFAIAEVVGEVDFVRVASAANLARTLRDPAVAAGFTPVAFGGFDLLREEWHDKPLEDGWLVDALDEAEALDGATILAGRILEEQRFGDVEVRPSGPDGRALQPTDGGFLPEVDEPAPIDQMRLLFTEPEAVVFVPTTSPWQVPVVLDWDGGGPSPSEHAAIWRLWHERFGAVPLAMEANSLTLQVPAPLADPSDALALAVEHLAYNSELMEGTSYNVDSVDGLAACLLRWPVWQFCWD